MEKQILPIQLDAKRSEDKELQIIRRIMKALGELPPEGEQRVLKYINDRRLRTGDAT